MRANAKKAVRPVDSEIPQNLQVEAAHVALCIRSALGEMRERALTIGELLLQMKGQLVRGTFTAWVQSACGLNMRSAENYMRAYCVTQSCPALKAAKSFKLDALYQLGRIADSEERQAALREIVVSRPAAEPAEVIAQLKLKFALPVANYRTLPAATPRAPGIVQRVELSLVVEMAELLGNRLSDFVKLVNECGAIAVCDALSECHRRSVENENFSFSTD
jgi:hypothetical protein